MRMSRFGAFFLVLWAVACGGTSATEEQQSAGTLRLPLTSASSDGEQYKLVGAQFTITGTQSVTVTDTSADTLSVPLTAGRYSIELGGDWHLESVAAPGQAVPSQLISPNPMQFSVRKGETSEVRFLFKLPGDGSADVGITVDSGGWISGTIQFSTTTPSDGSTLFDELVGTSVPFTVSFASATITRDTVWDGYGYQRQLRVETSPTVLQFGGPSSELLQDRVQPALQGMPILFTLTATSSGQVKFSGFRISGYSDRFDFGVSESEPFSAVLDSDGYPTARPFSFGSFGYLNRYDPATYAYTEVSGPASGDVTPY